MNKLLYALLGLVVLIAAGVLIGPSFVDWNAYKGRLEAELGDATGRPVTIGGAIQFTILPSPAFSAAQVRLANLAEGAAEPLLALEELRVRVEFWPLLQRRLQVESVTLTAPRLSLEVLPDGRQNWELGRSETAGGGGQSEAGEPLLAEVAFDSFTIKEGVVTYRDARNGRQLRIEALDAEVMAESLVGPFTVKGQGRLKDLDATFEIAAGRLHDAGATPFKAVVGLPAAEAELEVGGSFSRHPDSFGYRGTARANGPSLIALLDALGWSGQRAGLPPSAAQSFSLSADFSGDRALMAASELELLLADARLTGSASWRFQPDPEVRLKLRGARIDLDRLLAQPTDAAPTAPAVATAADDLGAALGWWRQFTLPAELDGELALEVDGVVLRGRTLRQLRFDAALDRGLLIVEQASIELPGGSRLRASGLVANKAEGARFSGTVEAESEDLRALSAWLGLVLEDLPADRLRRLKLSGQLTADAQEIRLDKADLQLDLSRINGGIVVALRQRLGLGVGLVVDKLNLDAYLPPAAELRNVGASPDATDEASRPGVAEVFAVWPAWVDQFDANLDLRIGHVIHRGQSLLNVQLNGTMHDGALSLRQAGIGDLAGAQAQFSGMLSSLSQAPRVDGTLALKVRDGGRFSRAVGLKAEGLPPLGAFTVTAALQGGQDDLAFDGQLAALGGTLDLAGSAKLLAEPLTYGLRIALQHPELAALLRALGRDVPHDAALGALALSAQASGTDRQARFEDLSLSAGRLELSGTLAADLAGDRPLITAVLAGGEVRWAELTDLGAGLAVADPDKGRPAVRPPDGGAAFDLTYLDALDAELAIALRALEIEGLRLDDLALQAKLSDGVLEVERLVAMLDKGTLQASGRLDAAPPTEASVELKLKGAGADELLGHWLPVQVAAGLLDLEAALATKGTSRAGMLANLSGRGRLAGQVELALPDAEGPTLQVAGLEAAARIFADAFGVIPARLEGRFELQDGKISTEDTRLAGEGAWATVAASADLAAATLDSTTVLYRAVAPDAPYLTARLTGALDEPDIALQGEPFRRKPPPDSEAEAPSAASSPDGAIEDLIRSLGN